MCINPVKIRNNSRYFKSGVSPLYNDVSCGKCEECISVLQQDWFVRLNYELEYYTNVLHGVCFFLTFTYNDENMPVFNFGPNTAFILDINSKRLSNESERSQNNYREFLEKYGENAIRLFPSFTFCHFDKSDLTAFMKSLRQYFDYNGIWPYNAENPIKVFCQCEYGELRHRPHMHLCFFVPFKISESDFIDICQKCWSYRIRKSDYPPHIVERLENKSSLSLGFTCCESIKGHKDYFIKKYKEGYCTVFHSRGFVRKNPNCSCVITNPAGLDYICKYVNKMDPWLSENKIFEFCHDVLRLFPRNISQFKDTNKQLYAILCHIRSMFPFRYGSNFLGISIMDEFGKLSDTQIVQKIVEGGLSINTLPRIFPVPAYIVNRVCYERDSVDNTLMRLTAVGRKVFALKMQKSVDNLEKKFIDTFSVYSRFLRKEEREKLQKLYPSVSLDADIFANYRDIAKYCVFFRNVVPLNTSLLREDRQVLFDSMIDYFVAEKKLENDVELPPSLKDSKAVLFQSHYSFNYAPAFDNFECTYLCMKDIRKIVKGRKYASKKEKEDEERQIRSMLKDFMYDSIRIVNDEDLRLLKRSA